MFRELGELPKRVVIDTNVLLNATFVMDGHARRATSLLRSQDLSPVIDEMIEQEAKRILRGKARKLELTFDVQQALDDFIRELAIIRLPPAPVLPLPRINSDDRHVVRAARHYGAWIMTSDAPLAAECEEIDIPTRSPWDVIMAKASQNGEGPKLEHIVQMMPPNPDTGFIFARVATGAWASGPRDDKHAVFDLENVGCVLYDNDTEEWVFEMPIGISARAKCPLETNETWAVCGSYWLPGGGRKGRVTIRAGKFPSTVRKGLERTLKRITSPSAGLGTIGRSWHGGNEGSWGGLKAIVTGPQALGLETFKAIVRVPEATPNPFDWNALEGALCATQALHDSDRAVSLTDDQLRQWLASKNWRGA